MPVRQGTMMARYLQSVSGTGKLGYACVLRDVADAGPLASVRKACFIVESALSAASSHKAKVAITISTTMIKQIRLRVVTKANRSAKPTSRS